MSTLEQIIAEEWRSRAPELAEWAMQYLVNRKDVWGQYSVLTPTELRRLKENGERSYKAMTLPAVAQRDTNSDKVTIDKLTRHFASRRHRRPQIIGLHAKSQQQTSRWMGIDIDNHATHARMDDDTGRHNLNAAIAWSRKLQQKGYDPLLFDSNGAGGFHLWIMFKEPAATDQVFAFSQHLLADWQERALERLPETFPKQLKEDSLGSWFRLPGLHHSRDHHSRIWQGDEGLDDPWLSGHAAIDTILAAMPGPPPSKAKVPRRKTSTPDYSTSKDAKPGDSRPNVTKRQFKGSKKTRVCVDLDGVLAHRTTTDRIGAPIDGAVEFTQALATRAEIVIHTARFSTRSGKARKPKTAAALELRISKWLTLHGFSWHAISSGTAKPIASAYVDDRAVVCRPQSMGLDAFDQALEDIDKLK